MINQYKYINVCAYVTLSVKTQLKSFFVICSFLQKKKNHPSYGKEHYVKV